MLGLFRRGAKKSRSRLAESALLCRYLKPSRVPSEYAQKAWEHDLGRSYAETLRRLMKSGELRKLAATEGLQLARVKDIKPVLRALELKVSGRKNELIGRLESNAPNEAQRLAAKHSKDAFVVTEAGQERATSFQKERDERRLEAQRKARRALKKGDVSVACDAVNEYYAWLPYNLRPGMNMGWDDPSRGAHGYSQRIEQILNAGSSWILENVPKQIQKALILCAAEKSLWPSDNDSANIDLSPEVIEQLEKPVSTYVDLIISWAHSAAVNASQKDLSSRGIEMVRIWNTAADDHVCRVCAPLDGAPEKYWKDRFPHGPPAHDGCRCGISLTGRNMDQLDHAYRERQARLRNAIEGWGNS